MKCGEKWGHNHKCPEKISLHILEELMELLPVEDAKEHSTDSSDSSEEEVFSLSQYATVGVQGKKTMKLHAMVNNQELLILIDSGSSCTFISETAATSLKCSVKAAPPVQVCVASGDKLQSAQQVSGFTFWT